MTARRPDIGWQRPPGIAAAGTLTCALAAWATAGSLAVTGDATGSRVALLAVWWIPAGVAAAMGAAATVLSVPARAWWPTLLPGLLLLPWLPFPVPPAFLGWVGPVSAWVWVATVVAVAAAWWGRLPIRLLADPRTAGLAAFAAGATAFLAAAWSASAVLPAGDAPHYLIITQSLLSDHDLAIENNHDRLDYEAYYSADLKPHYLRRGVDGRIYSIHAPGLPAVVAPAFAVGGYPGVVVFLALVCAAGAWLAWRTAYVLTGSVGAAWFGWGATALSAPFLMHAIQVFPDAPGAAVTMCGVAALVHLDASAADGAAGSRRVPWRWLLWGTALALLPWLHTRYAVIAGALGACVALRLIGRRRLGDVVAFLAIPAVSAAGWFLFFRAFYGTFNPAAPYGSYTQTFLGNIPRALPALLLDQQFGILPNAPAFGIAFAGLALMARRRPRLTMELVLVVFPYLAAVASYSMWWGGWSAPARFAVPVLLVLALPAADFWATRQSAGRAAGLAALSVGVLVTIGLTTAEGGRLIFNGRDGFARWLDWVAPLVDLPRALPSFLRQPGGLEWAQAAVWIGVLALAAAVLPLAARTSDPGVRRARLAIAAPCLFACAAMIAATIGWRLSAARPLTPTTAQLRLLDRFDGTLRPSGALLRPLDIVPASELVTRLRIPTSGRRLPGPPVPLILGSVPAGTYRVRMASASARYRSLEVKVGRANQPVERCVFDTPAAECRVHLPVAVTSLAVTGELQAGAAAEPLLLQPVAVRVEPPHPGVRPAGVDAMASRAARYGAVQVYTYDQLVWLEGQGFWMTGGRTDRIVLAPDAPRATVALLARNGPIANTVVLRSRGWSLTLSMGSGEERVLQVPLDAASGAVLLEVQTEGGFTPAKVDPRSRDERFLGVWLQPQG